MSTYSAESCKVFTKLVLEGQINSALRFLSESTRNVSMVKWSDKPQEQKGLGVPVVLMRMASDEC